MLHITPSMTTLTSKYHQAETSGLKIRIPSASSQYDSQTTSDLLNKLAQANVAIAVGRARLAHTLPPAFDFFGGSQRFLDQDDCLKEELAVAAKKRPMSASGDMSNSYTGARPLKAAHGQSYRTDDSRRSGTPSVATPSGLVTHSPVHERAWSHHGQAIVNQQGAFAKAMQDHAEASVINASHSPIAHSHLHPQPISAAYSDIASTTSPNHMTPMPHHASSSPFAQIHSPDDGNALQIRMPTSETSAVQQHLGSQSEYVSARPDMSMITQAKRWPEVDIRIAQQYQSASSSSPSLSLSSSSRTSPSMPNFPSNMSSSEPTQNTFGPFEADVTHRRAPAACNFCRVRKLRCDGSAPCRQCARRNLDCVVSEAATQRRRRRAESAMAVQHSAGASTSRTTPNSALTQARLLHARQGSKPSPRDMMSGHYTGPAEFAAAMAASSAASAFSQSRDGRGPAVAFPIGLTASPSPSPIHHQHNTMHSTPQHLSVLTSTTGHEQPFQQQPQRLSPLDQAYLYGPPTSVASISQAMATSEQPSSGQALVLSNITQASPMSPQHFLMATPPQGHR